MHVSFKTPKNNNHYNRGSHYSGNCVFHVRKKLNKYWCNFGVHIYLKSYFCQYYLLSHAINDHALSEVKIANKAFAQK